MPVLTYYGHSAFQLRDERFAVLIDPFLTGNPLCPIKASEIRKCDYILLSHGHADHVGDAIRLAKRLGSVVVATYELATWCASKSVAVHAMAPGGGYDLPFGRVKLTLAFHGMGGDESEDGMIPPNMPVGLLVKWHTDQVLYHAGDTGLFSDMKLIGEQQKIDVACLPIGDNFTMGIEYAAQAAEWLNASLYVPMHYNTFEPIQADSQRFAYRLQKAGKKCRILQPGEELEF